jgi:hypothetical protein
VYCDIQYRMEWEKKEEGHEGMERRIPDGLEGVPPISCSDGCAERTTATIGTVNEMSVGDRL